ncbi:MAG: tetraacyldisaccharide 4'-kinase [Pseudomonadota bacterium]
MNAPAHWSRRGGSGLLLLPLSWLFGALAALRRLAYRSGLLRSGHPGVPVIVVGNITAGGSGKTPLVIALVKLFRTHGLRAGVVSRGYAAAATSIQLVEAHSDPAAVGDEPVLIAQRAGCPVAVAPRRLAAAELLASREDVDLIVTDDGLQHYALQRDIEIAVVDARAGLGNRWLMPAGPLREPPWRLDTVDHVVHSGDAEGYDVLVSGVHRVDGDADVRSPGAFADVRVHAVAGIAHPEKFFDTLRSHGVAFEPHPFGDHHRFVPSDLQFDDGRDIVMTEKDAVKCRAFAGPNVWALRIEAVLARSWSDALLRQTTELVAHYRGLECG